MVANLVLIGVLQSIHARGELGRGVRMKAAGVAAFVGEMKSLGLTLREEIAPARVGPIVVSGVLAEQLAKELGAGAAPGAVVVGDDRRCAHARRCSSASSPATRAPEDTELVREAATQRRRGGHRRALATGRTGLRPSFSRRSWSSAVPDEGFPIREIADRIVRGHGRLRGARSSEFPRSPTPRARALIKQAVIRSALIGAGSEPVRRVAASHLARAGAYGVAAAARVVRERTMGDDRTVLAAGAAAVLASGFALSETRSVGAGRSCPIRLRTPPSPRRAPGRWRRRSRRLESRLPSDE